MLVDHILPENRIKAGRYITTNDPKESKSWQFSAGTNENINLGEYDLTELSIQMTKGLKHSTNVMCFSMDRTLTGDHTKDINNRGFSRPRMWAQYSDNHKGVCIIFDRLKLQNAFLPLEIEAQIYGGVVEYRNRSPFSEINSSPYTVNADFLDRYGEEKYLRDHIFTHHRRLFFEKCLDWRDEVEYRFVIFGKNECDIYVDFKDALLGVVFGADCSEEVIKNVTNQSRSQKRELWFEQLIWKGCAPWYSFRLVWP